MSPSLMEMNDDLSSITPRVIPVLQLYMALVAFLALV